MNYVNRFLPRTLVFTVLALFAFAANSVLCRLALGDGSIDAGSFTVIRLLSGIVVLVVLVGFSGKDNTGSAKGSWLASFMLFVYAAAFSFAYNTLATGTGALILFASVQITMVLLAFMSGQRFGLIEGFGLSLAFAGLVYLVLPRVSTPSFLGFVLMAIAGIAWGAYSYLGRASKQALKDTAGNFIKTLPFVAILSLATIMHANYSIKGIILAVLSGAVASGIGYTLWYMALGGLTAVQAAVLQLLVPLIAAVGGVVFVGEKLTWQLVVSAALILGGILIVIVGNSIIKGKPTALADKND